SGARTLSVNDLSIAATGQLDLSDGFLVVRATAETRDAMLASVTSALASGYGAPGAHWQGPGINSSTAAADSEHLTAIGVMSNATASNHAVRASFGGESVDANAILARLTYIGDADLSGAVGGVDMILTDGGAIFGRGGWRNGDFDYSGAVDGADYAMLDTG